MDLVIVTGMSGAGKTQAVNALEDVGYFCVDNVPPRLVGKFAELPAQSGGKISRIALVVDVRSKELFDEYVACLDELKASHAHHKVLFLDCSDAILMNRYKETRRRHPLLSEETSSVEEAIRRERGILLTAKSRADFTLDTSRLSAADMKSRIREMFAEGIRASMMVTVRSFGFKRGAPTDTDLLFDVRCLPNPYYVAELREKTGLEARVREYVLGSPQARGLVPKLLDLLDYLIPLYIQEGKSQLVIAVGCTGGRHRSVAFAELIAAHLRGQGQNANAEHRDLAETGS